MSESPIVPTSNNPSNDRPERYRRATTNTTGNAGGFITTVLLIVVVVGVALLGWLTWQQSNQLEQASERLNVLTQKVSVLEQEIEVTGSTLAESDSDMVESVKLWESETRKLWDLYNQRIKTAIEGLESDVARTSGQLSQFQESIDEVQTNMLLLTRAQQDLTDKLNLMDQQVARKIADFELQVKSNKETIDAIDRSRSSNNNRILELERKYRELSNL